MIKVEKIEVDVEQSYNEDKEREAGRESEELQLDASIESPDINTSVQSWRNRRIMVKSSDKVPEILERTRTKKPILER